MKGRFHSVANSIKDLYSLKSQHAAQLQSQTLNLPPPLPLRIPALNKLVKMPRMMSTPPSRTSPSSPSLTIAEAIADALCMLGSPFLSELESANIPHRRNIYEDFGSV